jgi:oxygen-dependent protoporphyrinogen oxidase
VKIAIIGGGIAGLSAAWQLEKSRRAGAAVEYRLFERSSRLGGVVQTERLADGSLLEAGPDSFLSEKPWAAALCAELGLQDRLVGSNDADRKTFILLHGRLVPLPDGLQFLVPTRIAPVAGSRLFSLAGKLRFAREYLFPPAPLAENEDESVAQFVTRHFGSELVERLAEPLLAGIYGGHADGLSVRAVLPRMARMEAEHGSLIRAVLRARKSQPAGPGSSRPLFTSLRGGMQEMTDALVAQLNPLWLHTGAGVESLRQSPGAWYARTADGEQQFDAVILALPAWAAATLMHDTSRPESYGRSVPASELARLLAVIPYSSSVIVNLGYQRSALSTVDTNKLAGFGFLVPRTEGRKLLACTYTHNKFPHRVTPGRAIFRCFFAAETADQIMAQSDSDIAALAVAELRAILGLPGEPDLARVARWPQAMAQYTIGHLQRVTEIEQLCQNLPGLALAGNGFRGIGVPDCVRTGTEAAQRLAQAAGVPVRVAESSRQ